MTPAEIAFALSSIKLVDDHFTAIGYMVYAIIAAWFVIRLVTALRH